MGTHPLHLCVSVEERRALWKQLEENQEATLERHCELWENERGVRVSVSTMSRAVRKLGWTFKKGCEAWDHGSRDV
ncbi:MAG: hypothetical protein M3Q60_16320 [Actinomycetota bacterium]|nr:hypothetical protein [Actinomycetota bacterium]